MTQKFTLAHGQGGNESQAIIDIQQVRERRAQEKKRRAERVFFRNILNVFSKDDSEAFIPIDLIEVSEQGCSFQVPAQLASSWPERSEEIPICFYFSTDSYFEIRVKIANASHSIDGKKKMVRFGCLVDLSQPSYPVFLHFVRFLKVYADLSVEADSGQRGASI